MAIEIRLDWRETENRMNNMIRYVKNPSEWFKVQGDVYELAEKAKQDMEDTIEQSRKQPGNGERKLENAIQIENLMTTTAQEITGGHLGIEVGVGNIDTLKSEAPYFELINDGGTYITKTEHIVPFADGEFRTFLKGSSHTIDGIDYVGKAEKMVEKEIDKIVTDAGETILSSMKNI